jgi:class 3 adenylate cyclase
VAIGRVVSVNVGRPRTLEWFGRQVNTAISRIAASAEVPESWRAMAQRALRRATAG